MAQINLLPWREEYRQEKKKEFFTHLVIVAAIAAVLCFVWVKAAQAALDNQVARNAMLKTEIAALEEQVKEIKNLKQKKRQLLDRIKVIQDLQGTRPLIVRYFDELAKSVPDGVYLDVVERSGDSMKLKGVSESNNRVSNFLRQLNASEFYSDPNLESVTADSKNGDSKVFDIRVKMVKPATVEESKDNG